MKKDMLINVLQPEECRIAILEDGILEELYVERTSHESYVGNIYKGRIVNIEPSIQAAFVDFGVGRNGFLHVSDVEPAYYRHLEQRSGNGGAVRGRDRYRQPAHDDEEFPRLGIETNPSLNENQAPRSGREREQGEEQQDRPRGRGRSRRGRRDGRRRGPEDAREARPARELPEAQEPIDDAQEQQTEWPESDVDQAPRPRPMDSAERRTDEDGPDHDPLNPGDADVFFPRAGSTEEPERRPEILEHPERDEEWDSADPAFDDEGGQTESEEIDRRGVVVESTGDDLEDEEHGERPRGRGRRREREERGGRRGRRPSGRFGQARPKPLIQDIFRRGQEVLVQVIKEGIGTKGPTLSTYISIAGRYLVLMPGLNRIGVSRKIADEEQRRRLREILGELRPPKGLGFIIRTAGLDRTKKDLQRDLAYLSRLWQVVVRRIRKLKAPAEIYQESDMITRTIRDTFTGEIDTIWVDEPAAFEHAQEFLQIVMPRYASRIKLYADSEPMFHKHGIEDEIARIQQRHVPLPNGGSIVIDQTEALVAIDVNSGNFRADNNAEETAYQMNLLAAKEIARQLRLRDLGGVIVNDFIDMREEKHRRGVERALREAVKRDRARTKILRISAFGMIEMTRQRIRPSLKRSVYQDCPHCRGTGQVKTAESMSIDVMRLIQLAAHRENVHRIQVTVAEEVAHYLQNRKRREISRLEEGGEIQVSISGAQGAPPEQLTFECFDNNNNEVRFFPRDESAVRRR
jgi:ribonuclease E